MRTTSGDQSTAVPAEKALAVVATAKKALGIPYVWGGTNYKLGVDCSGLVYVAYRAHNVNIPRTSQEQYKVGTPVKKGQAIPGDLVFSYANEGGVPGPGHVVMAIGNGKCIAAPKTGTTVQIQDLSIFDSVYVGTKRIIPAAAGGSGNGNGGNDNGGDSGSSISASSAFSTLTDTHTYYRGFQFMLGAALLIAGILIITKQSPVKLAQKASKVAEIAAVA